VILKDPVGDAAVQAAGRELVNVIADVR
jgi:hypothetical protein